jgi:dTDP-4-dehydrorhamnose reductase
LDPPNQEKEIAEAKKMKVLITGGSSMLGRYLLETKPKDAEIALTRNKNDNAIDGRNIWYNLDVRNRADVCDVFEIFRPNLVIHCAALGGVDFAEGNKEVNPNGYQLTFDVNVTGTKHVIDICNGYKAKIIYISTNAVFSGNLPPYNEKSPLEPVNSYGVIKSHAERTVRNSAKKWLIIRPFLMYGWPHPGGRTNWAAKLVETLGNKSYKLVHDHIWQPTYAREVAETIWYLSNQDHEIYNVAAPERATLYEFGLKVCDVFGLEKNLLQPVESGYFPTIAPRPKDTTYDLVKLAGEGIILSDLKTGLEKMRKESE